MYEHCLSSYEALKSRDRAPVSSTTLPSPEMPTLKDPKGWTSNVNAKDRVDNMLTIVTKLDKVNVKQAEIGGTQYLFQSGDKFYFWNTANEEAGEVTKPTTYDAILQQMDTDITQVKVTLLGKQA
ncbi:hypothetical protein EIP86_001325 [Pleurotus ostreatoroseus]|nr:hypothetical protein EIP86_001325 [Pleurotus ostreatoroseus]